MPSRYCETDKLTDVAWSLFANTPPGWARVQAIVDCVHNHVTFGYQHAHHRSRRMTSTSSAPASAATSRIWR